MVLYWLDGCFRFNGPLRQCFSLYRVVSQREGERMEKSKMPKQPPCPTIIQIVGRPGTGSWPRAIASPDPRPPHTHSRMVLYAGLFGKKTQSD